MAKKLQLTQKRKAWAASRKEAPVFRGDPLQHNAAVAVRYVKAVQALTAQVKREVLRLFDTDAAAAHFGTDATIASQSRILINSLANRFTDLFAKKAKPLAESMVADAGKSGTKALHASLQKLSGGMSLKTSLSNPAIENITKAAVAENVSLIKSIASKYLQQVEGAVMRSITTGNGLQDLVPALEQYEGQTHRRAKNIALDQTRKVYNSINKGRMEALGVQKFMWHHSGGGAHPREDHVEMDGEIYSFKDLPVIDQRTGERGIPGQAPNCLVGDTLIDLSNGCDYVWRYFYEGDILSIEFDGGSVSATPNHPFLTQRGWVKAKDLELSDYVIQAHGQGLFAVKNDIANREITIEQAFFSVAPILRKTRAGSLFNFHGDIPDSPVEEVRPDFHLAAIADSRPSESVEKDIFPGTDSNRLQVFNIFESDSSAFLSEGGAALGIKPLHPDTVSFRSGSNREPVLLEDAGDDVARNPMQEGNSLNAHFAPVSGDDRVVQSLDGGLAAGFRRFYATSAEGLAEVIRVDLERTSGIGEGISPCYSLRSIRAKRVSKFVGFVHTMQTPVGWFKSTSAGIITKNCRCTMSPVFDFDKE